MRKVGTERLRLKCKTNWRREKQTKLYIYPQRPLHTVQKDLEGETLRLRKDLIELFNKKLWKLHDSVKTS